MLPQTPCFARRKESFLYSNCTIRQRSVFPSHTLHIASKHLLLPRYVYLLSHVRIHNQSRNTLREMRRAVNPTETQLTKRMTRSKMTASSHPVRETGQEPRGSYKALQECCSQKALNTSTSMYTQLDGIESGRKNTPERRELLSNCLDSLF